MGTTIAMTLAYGIDLGGPSQGWKFREADEGTWEPEWHTQSSIISCAERVLLANAGLDPDDDTLEEARGLEFLPYRAPGHASWMLTVWHKTIYPGDIYDVNWTWINHQRIEEDWDAKLIEALNVLGVNSMGVPTWLMTSYID